MSGLIFFDTEFTELGFDAKLISIGLVAEDGEQTFYAELSDTYRETDCGDFAREVVLPLLEGDARRMTMAELKVSLGNWLEGFGQSVRLVTDSLSWDWPWIQELFREPGAWPANVEKSPFILEQSPEFCQAVETAFDAGLRQHHSLDDAKANRIAWLQIRPSAD